MNPDDRALSLFFDDELDVLETAETARRLKTDPGARARVLELGRIRTGIREWARTQSANIDVSDAVMERLERERLPLVLNTSDASSRSAALRG